MPEFMSDPNAYYAGDLAVASYDALVGDGGPIAGDVAFYLDCARRFGGPVLELATGTGRVLMPLAEAGHEVVGVDLSGAMLEVARAKARRNPQSTGRIELVEGDMRDFSLGRRFSLALVPARAFQHVIEPEDQGRTLRCIHRHLEPGGHLVVDLFDPNFELLAVPAEGMPVRSALHPVSGHLLRRTVVARHNDPYRQVVHETLRLEEVDGSGQVVATEETSWALRWSLRQEMAYLFELCGFDVVEQFSDFNGSPPAYGREQVWVVSAR
jgi:ubiquinone/menaquinone biosynthesis C-methylase UbiE